VKYKKDAIISYDIIIGRLNSVGAKVNTKELFDSLMAEQITITAYNRGLKRIFWLEGLISDLKSYNEYVSELVRYAKYMKVNKDEYEKEVEK